MPKADFFTRFGLFAIEDYFDANLCAKVCLEMQTCISETATILGKNGNCIVDENIRRTKCTKVFDETKALVNSYLLSLQSKLEEHFQISLTGWEKPQFLKYNKGDFYRQHQDSNTAIEAPKYIQDRKISLVIFLNSESEKPESDSYGGGELTLYGLVDNPLWQKYGFSLNGEAGLLIAFRSDIFHEVKPVTHGERYTVVTWFF